MIYVIGEYRYPGSPIKVGYSGGGPAGVRKRLATLQTGNPRRLAILATCEGDRELERDLHMRFRQAHIHGEWFRRLPAVERFLAQHSLAPPYIFESRDDGMHQNVQPMSEERP